MRRAIFLMGAVALLIAPAAVHGQLWSDNFDSYTVGTINGQGLWEGWDAVASAAGEVATAPSPVRSPPNSLRITAGDDCIRQYALMLLPPNGSGIYEYKTHIYVPAVSTGEHYFLMQNIYNHGGPYNWSIQVQFDLNAGTVTSEADGVTLPLVTDQWTEISVRIDLVNDPPAPTRPCVPNSPGTPCGTSQIFYDGCALGGPEPWLGRVSTTTTPPDGPGVLDLGAIDLFTSVGPATVYYDDFTFEDVGGLPAPLSIGTAGLPVSLRNQSYAGAAITAFGGSGSGYMFTLDSGTPPPGMNVALNGDVTGTPTAAGEFPFIVRVTDSLGAMATKQIRVDVLNCTDLLMGLVFDNVSDGAGCAVPEPPVNSQLVTFHAVTNTIISTVNVDRPVHGLARDPFNGVLYTVSSDDTPSCQSTPSAVLPNLYTLDANTGVTTLVGQIPFNLNGRAFVGGLAVHPLDGRLFYTASLSTSPNTHWTLIELNKTNGQIITQVDFGNPLFNDFADSLAFSQDGTLYAVDGRTQLVTVDLATGALTDVVGVSGGAGSSGMTFMDNRLFYVNGPGLLYSISQTPNIDPVCQSVLPSSALSGVVPGSPNMYGLVSFDAIPACACPGDMDGSGRADINDASAFVNALLTGGDCANMNGDCDANGADIADFIETILTAGGFGRNCAGNPPAIERCDPAPAPPCFDPFGAFWCSFLIDDNLSECTDMPPGSIFCVACAGPVCRGPLNGLESFIWTNAPSGPCEIVGLQILGDPGGCLGCADGSGTYLFTLSP